MSSQSNGTPLLLHAKSPSSFRSSVSWVAKESAGCLQGNETNDSKSSHPTRTPQKPPPPRNGSNRSFELYSEVWMKNSYPIISNFENPNPKTPKPCPSSKRAEWSVISFCKTRICRVGYLRPSGLLDDGRTLHSHK